MSVSTDNTKAIMELIKDGEYHQLSNHYNPEYRNYFFIQFFDATRKIQYVGLERKETRKMIKKWFNVNSQSVIGTDETIESEWLPIFTTFSHAILFKSVNEAQEFYKTHGLVHQPGYSIKLVDDYFKPIIVIVSNPKADFIDVRKEYVEKDGSMGSPNQSISKFYNEEMEYFDIDTEFDKFEARFKQIKIDILNNIHNKLIAIQQIRY